MVIGPTADREAREKSDALRAVGALVTWLTQAEAVREEDVAAAAFVILTPPDEAVARRLRGWADRHRFLFCAIDQPRYGGVAMPAIVAAGPARIAILTGGVAPRVAGLLRAALQAALDETFVRFLGRCAEIRRRARENYPESEQRRDMMKHAVDGFAVDVRLTYPGWFTAERDRSGPSVSEEPSGSPAPAPPGREG